ncbi:ArsR/SmtB family transcription factor [Tepidicella baoligensis]|uniref:ArsR/SmtB family transcription factor n=1 Tax=Tepidicella baoligensis TaxID=2707016 RepID=UPI0015DAA831|nr:metalloregulator ArsR/SmtB family transcription factor [Tepidicella baoligensis]
MTETEVIKALSALAQETRLRIFRCLVVAGRDGLTPTRLSEALDTSPAALSFHLKELSHAGLAHAERVGRHLIYRADVEAMNTLLGFLTDNCCGGEPCLHVGLPGAALSPCERC